MPPPDVFSFPSRRSSNLEDLRRWPATTSRAAAELSDRLLARGRARLLHDSLLGAAGRPAVPQHAARQSTWLNFKHLPPSSSEVCCLQTITFLYEWLMLVL